MSLKRVLVVDDTPDVLESLTELVRVYGYDAEMAINGETARAALAGDDSIRIVITDYGMPGMNGVELIGHVRRDHPTVKVVLVTADNSPALEKRAIAAGADAVFVKPVSWDDLGPKIAELIS